MPRREEEGVIAPELEGPRWKVLTLQTLRAYAAEVLGVEVSGKTIRAAYDAAVAYLEEQGFELSYACGRCNCRVHDQLERCWACGAVFREAEEVRVQEEEVKDRARRLGISIRGKSEDTLREEIEIAERNKRVRKRDADIGALEARGLGDEITNLMPASWSKSEAVTYFAFRDSNGVKRITLNKKGLMLRFAVEDGSLDSISHVSFIDKDERLKRHFGRDNYLYNGSSTREAIQVVNAVIKRYS